MGVVLLLFVFDVPEVGCEPELEVGDDPDPEVEDDPEPVLEPELVVVDPDPVVEDDPDPVVDEEPVLGFGVVVSGCVEAGAATPLG